MPDLAPTPLILRWECPRLCGLIITAEMRSWYYPAKGDETVGTLHKILAAHRDWHDA